MTDDTATDGLSEPDRKDLDETRRLLLMALVAPRTKRYNLAGTILNALLYHQKVGTDRDLLIDRVVTAVDGSEPTDTRWIWDEIGRITAELEDG